MGKTDFCKKDVMTGVRSHFDQIVLHFTFVSVSYCFVLHTWPIWPLNPWEIEHTKESSNRKNRCQKHEWSQRKTEDRDMPLPWKERSSL